MAKTNFFYNAFNAGEISELISDRNDVSKFQSACRIMENAFPLVEGGAQKQPGTYYVNDTKGDQKAVFLPFTFSTIQTYNLEFGNQYTRFYMNDGQIIIDPSETVDYDPNYAYFKGMYVKLGPYGTYRWTGGAQLNISFPYGSTSAPISVTLNSSNALSVTVVGGTLTIKLANGITTGHQGLGTDNSADLIQEAIIALGVVGGVDFTKVRVSANAAYNTTLPVTAPDTSAFSSTSSMYQCIQAVPNYAASGSYYWANGAVLTIYYSVPSWWQQTPQLTGPPIMVVANTEDYLLTKMVPSPYGSYLTVQLADTTGAKNMDSIIALSIQSVGVIDNVPYWNVSASGNTTYDNAPPTTAPVSFTWGNSVGVFPTDTNYWKPVNIGDPVEIVTPYLAADLMAVDAGTQSADVLFFAHNQYPMMKLTRYSHINWELVVIDFTGTMDINKTGAGGIAKPINSVTTQNPCTIYCGNHDLVVGDRIYISGVTGMVELNQNIYTVITVANDHKITINVDSTQFNGGQSAKNTGTLVRVDKLFTGVGDYPGCCTFYEERLYVGGTVNNPTQFNGSVQGDFYNFISDPSGDDYAVQFPLVQQVDPIRRMLATSSALLLGTLGGIWSAAGTSGASITQNNISAQKQISTGVGIINPQRVNDVAIWVTRSGHFVYFIIYNFITNQWDNYDLTRLNRQITMGDSAADSGIIQTAFQAEPYPIYWAVRADGQLLGLVYNKQDQVFAWFRIKMDGLVESVACISQDNAEDEVWTIVNRTINGVTKRFIEYFMPQELFGQLSNAFFVHAGLTWNGVSPASITGITRANPAVVTAPSHGLITGMTVKIADVQGMVQINNDSLSAYTVTVTNANTFHLNGVDSSTWTPYTLGGTVAQVTNTLTGLGYLQGKTVVAVGDNALISGNGIVVPSSGAITLAYYANQITVGLPYTMIVEPVNPMIGNREQTSKGERQKINEINVSVYNSVGGKYGTDPDDTNGLYELEYGPGSLGKTPKMITQNDIPVNFPGDWGYDSRICIVHDSPFPFTLRSISVKLTVNPS